MSLFHVKCSTVILGKLQFIPVFKEKNDSKGHLTKLCLIHKNIVHSGFCICSPKCCITNVNIKCYCYAYNLEAPDINYQAL